MNSVKAATLFFVLFVAGGLLLDFIRDRALSIEGVLSLMGAGFLAALIYAALNRKTTETR